MDKKEVINNIEQVVNQVLGFSVTDENDNILSCRHQYPVIFLVYVTQKLAEIYGESIYNIFRTDDYNIWQVSNLADAIINVCENSIDNRIRA